MTPAHESAARAAADPAPGESAWNKARIEALSDGIFAIVMTLLVLEIKVPELPRSVPPLELWHAIGEHGFLFVSFFITFLLASGFWFWHHLSFHHIRRCDGVILGVNLVFLMFVSLLPYSTALLGSFKLGQPVSLAFYFGNQLALGLTFNVHWRYALRRGFVENPDTPVLRRLSRGVLVQPIACIAALLTLFVDPKSAFEAFFIVQMAGIGILRARDRKRAAR